MKVLLILFMMLTTARVFGMGIKDTNPALENHSAAPQQNHTEILQATVRIEIKAYNDRLIGHALGSLIQVDDEVMVVTHNHWGPLLNEEAIIELRSEDRRLLATETGKQLIESLHFQDEGTLIYPAPEAVYDNMLIATRGLPSQRATKRLAPGTRVEIVQFRERDNGSIVVREMEVMEGKETVQPPIYRLRSLDGLPILPGDSGGGVWVDGALAGNLWANLLVEANDPHATTMLGSDSGDLYHSEISYAAILSWPRMVR
jgi:hypothetical protein